MPYGAEGTAPSSVSTTRVRTRASCSGVSLPDHREALLGRTVCLTHLSRHDEAIAAATRLIELGMYHVGEAQYAGILEVRAPVPRSLTMPGQIASRH